MGKRIIWKDIKVINSPINKIKGDGMKDYKKIYNRLIKEIKRMKMQEENFESFEPTERLRLLDKIESRYAVSVLNSILEMSVEIEGRMCNLVIMNQKEFNNWKKKIGKRHEK